MSRSRTRPAGRVRLRDFLKVVLTTLACAVLLKSFVLEAYRIPTGSMENTLLAGDMILVDKLSYGIRIPSSIPFLPFRLEARYLLSLGNIRRGDVIVFEIAAPEGLYGGRGNISLVKRCIGLPGDTVEIRSSRVFVNGFELLEPSTVRAPRFEQTLMKSDLFPDGYGFTEWEYGPLRVPRKGDTVRLDPDTRSEWLGLIEREGHRVDRTETGKFLVDGSVQTSCVLSGNYYFVLGDHRENSIDSRKWGFVCGDDIVGEALMVYWSSPPFADGRPPSPGRRIRWERVGSLIR